MVAKVFESVIRDVMMEYLLSNNLISDEEHGFMPMRSCMIQLLSVMDDWIDALDYLGY